MGLNDKVSAERVHIGFFGIRNAGKSSVVNAVTGQNLSLVSDVKGTTTDPVQKAMELLPMGPVVIIDTPGLDDEGELGRMRVKRAIEVLDKTDVAVIVTDCQKAMNAEEKELTELFRSKNIPYIIVRNKADLIEVIPEAVGNEVFVSAKEGTNIDKLKEMIAALSKGAENDKKIVADLLDTEDVVILVVPIDSSAPKGRLILPQQQTIRDILDGGAIPVVVRDTELSAALKVMGKKPKMVITDSQAFGRVSKIVPADVMLTSFSILFARYKGDLKEAVRGAAMLDNLKNGDRILISEGCTHHRQCGDIGTVKLPAWIKEHCGKEISFEFTSGGDFPENTEQYALVIHCGGCMLGEKEMKSRILRCTGKNVPVTNYGIAIAHVNGILKRSVEPFPEIVREINFYTK